MSMDFAAEIWAEMAAEAREAALKVNDPALRLPLLLRAARYVVLSRLAERHRARTAGDAHRPEQTSFGQLLSVCRDLAAAAAGEALVVAPDRANPRDRPAGE